MGVILISILLLATLMGALFLAVRKATAAASVLPLNADWIEELSMERYRPMARLFGREDLEFLRSQPGYTPEMAARFRAERTQIFRAYLKNLSEDFHRVCTAVKILMLQSTQDRPELAVLLVRRQLTFAFGMAIVNARLTLHQYGICGVDAAVLMEAFDAMRIELRTVAPVSCAAAA